MLHSNITSEDLILYLYDESLPEQAENVQMALETDWNLREKYELMRHVQKRLGTIKCSPSKRSIDYVLNYAEKLASGISEEV